ncbi:inositol 1,4,5-triphosphate receptor associated 2 isoform X1, partial [Tachysurus ichikawai]
SGLLPVAEEEELMSEASQQGASAVNCKAASGATGTSAVKDNGASVPLTIRNRIKKDLSRTAAEEPQRNRRGTTEVLEGR